MKILTLSNCPLVEHQGSGYNVLNFCKGLRQRGHEVDVFGPASYEPLAFLKKARRHRQSLGMAVRAVFHLGRKKTDLVEFYGAESWLAVTLLRKLKRRNFLLVAHSNGIETHFTEKQEYYLGHSTFDGAPPRWYQTIFKPPVERAFTQVDALVTVSRSDREYVLHKGYQDDPHVIAIENALPDNFLGLPVNFQRPKVLGFCGSWLPAKGTEILRTDVSRILTDFPDAEFKIIGVGRHFLKEHYFPANTWPRIRVFSFVEDKRTLQQFYQSIGILVVPSVYESFGLAMAEAMACGCAVVAAKTGFAAHLRHGIEALVINQPQSPLFYQALKELFLNEQKRLSIARAGYQRVQSLRWDSSVQQLESAYAHWLDEFRKNKRPA